MNCTAAPTVGDFYPSRVVSSQSRLPCGRGWCKVKGGTCLPEGAAGGVSQIDVCSGAVTAGEQGGIVGG